MGRKNKRLKDDIETYLPPIKEEWEWRPAPKCSVFPNKAVFTTGYRAQVAIDEIRYTSDREKIPVRVYECKESDGGCSYFHITSQEEYDNANRE